ncbi:MAG: dimethylargininase [Anaerolineaceae bacterium]|nr:dimethylargininase [Anaerolineaceae bacterium]
MTIAITRLPAASIANCELTFIDRIPIDYAKAIEQHQAYCDGLRACGVEVVTLPAVNDLPDSVFVEDTAIILDEVAIITPMGIASRRPEPLRNEAAIARYRPLAHITLPATIEGGDVMRLGKAIFVSLSTRTNEAGIEALRILTAPYGYTVTQIALHDCLHLKSACTALDDHTILLNRAWVDTSSFEGYKLIDVAMDEAGAGNVVQANGSILMNSQFPQTAIVIEEHGYPVCAVDTSEFTKAEAAMTCMSLIIEE